MPTQKVLAHDPVMIHVGATYYLFTTGPGISVWTSPDRQCWTFQGPVFTATPSWVEEVVPEFHGHFWAPDIVARDGLFYLYYSASAFGRNTSAIGVATNPTLDPNDPEFHWTDHGKVVESWPGVTNWNAIDPQYIEDRDGTPYLAFGSFWGGLKIARLSPSRDALAESWETLRTIASRAAPTETENANGNYSDKPGDGAIEAPFIYRHGAFFYLFASTDYCCRGPASTYKMIVGRSAEPLGPYLDQDGVPLLEGGGTILLEGNDRWYGVGHNAVYRMDGEEIIVFHGYDATSDPPGRPHLRIERLRWDAAGWPHVELSLGNPPDSPCPPQ